MEIEQKQNILIEYLKDINESFEIQPITHLHLR